MKTAKIYKNQTGPLQFTISFETDMAGSMVWTVQDHNNQHYMNGNVNPDFSFYIQFDGVIQGREGLNNYFSVLKIIHTLAKETFK